MVMSPIAIASRVRIREVFRFRLHHFLFGALISIVVFYSLFSFLFCLPASP